jgi:hypothetical protein
LCDFVQVDILNARELKAYGDYYVVAKLDGLLCRTNYIKQNTNQCPPDGTPVPSDFVVVQVLPAAEALPTAGGRRRR